jgi:hypothetical protein
MKTDWCPGGVSWSRDDLHVPRHLVVAVDDGEINLWGNAQSGTVYRAAVAASTSAR